MSSPDPSRDAEPATAASPAPSGAQDREGNSRPSGTEAGTGSTAKRRRRRRSRRGRKPATAVEGGQPGDQAGTAQPGNPTGEAAAPAEAGQPGETEPAGQPKKRRRRGRRSRSGGANANADAPATAGAPATGPVPADSPTAPGAPGTGRRKKRRRRGSGGATEAAEQQPALIRGRRRTRSGRIEEVSAGGLVVDASGDEVRGVLIGKHDRKGRLVWSLPKGHVETGETLEQTAVREIEEETGVTAEVRHKLGEVDYWFMLHGEKIHKTVHHFLLRFVSGELCDRDVEVAEVAWVPLAEIPAKLAYPDERRLVARVPELLPRAM